MRVALVFIIGLVTGAFAYLLWPSPVAGIMARRAAPDPAIATSAQPAAAPSARSQTPAARARVDEILRQAGLFPLPANAPRLSWLYVRAREEWLLKSEKYVEASITGLEGRVDQQCGTLFIQLGLAPEDEDRLRRTLAEMVQAQQEINTLTRNRAARIPPAEVQAMLAESNEDFRQRIRAQLGEAGFARFENYFDAQPERAELANAFLRVGALAGPLSAEQREALVAARQARKAGRPSPVYIEGLLSPAQREVFLQWESDELAQSLLGELMPKSSAGRPGIPRAIYARAEAPAPRSP